MWLLISKKKKKKKKFGNSFVEFRDSLTMNEKMTNNFGWRIEWKFNTVCSVASRCESKRFDEFPRGKSAGVLKLLLARRSNVTRVFIKIKTMIIRRFQSVKRFSSFLKIIQRSCGFSIDQKLWKATFLIITLYNINVSTFFISNNNSKILWIQRLRSSLLKVIM